MLIKNAVFSGIGKVWWDSKGVCVFLDTGFAKSDVAATS